MAKWVKVVLMIIIAVAYVLPAALPWYMARQKVATARSDTDCIHYIHAFYIYRTCDCDFVNCIGCTCPGTATESWGNAAPNERTVFITTWVVTMCCAVALALLAVVSLKGKKKALSVSCIALLQFAACVSFMALPFAVDADGDCQGVTQSPCTSFWGETSHSTALEDTKDEWRATPVWFTMFLITIAVFVWGMLEWRGDEEQRAPREVRAQEHVQIHAASAPISYGEGITTVVYGTMSPSASPVQGKLLQDGGVLRQEPTPVLYNPSAYREEYVQNGKGRT